MSPNLSQEPCIYVIKKGQVMIGLKPISEMNNKQEQMQMKTLNSGEYFG